MSASFDFPPRRAWACRASATTATSTAAHAGNFRQNHASRSARPFGSSVRRHRMPLPCFAALKEDDNYLVDLGRLAEIVTISMSFNYSGTVARTRYLTSLVMPW